MSTVILCFGILVADLKFVQEDAPVSRKKTVVVQAGSFATFSEKSVASSMQKYIVPWSIALYCLAVQVPKEHALGYDISPLKSTKNEPTHYVTPKTNGYIHRLSFNCIADLPSDACNTRALRNETMILEVLEEQEPAVFRQELFNTLLYYYEVVQSIPGAGGRPKPKSFKRPMLSAPSRAAVVADAGGGRFQSALEY